MYAIVFITVLSLASDLDGFTVTSERSDISTTGALLQVTTTVHSIVATAYSNDTIDTNHLNLSGNETSDSVNVSIVHDSTQQVDFINGTVAMETTAQPDDHHHNTTVPVVDASNATHGTETIHLGEAINVTVTTTMTATTTVPRSPGNETNVEELVPEEKAMLVTVHDTTSTVAIEAANVTTPAPWLAMASNETVETDAVDTMTLRVNTTVVGTEAKLVKTTAVSAVA